MDIRFKSGDCNSQVFLDAKLIRQSVFVEEQGFKVEFDDADSDENTIHVVAYDGDSPVGCARIIPPVTSEDKSANEWTLGRFSVLPEYRGSGLGSKIVIASESEAKSRGASSAKLHAQCRVSPFYEKLGYEKYGPIEKDEHVDHIWMRKAL